MPAQGHAVAPYHVPSLRLGESHLLRSQGRVPEGRDDDEFLAFPLAGLGELDIEGFPVGATALPSGRLISPVKVPVTLVTTVIQSPRPNWTAPCDLGCDIDQVIDAGFDGEDARPRQRPSLFERVAVRTGHHTLGPHTNKAPFRLQAHEGLGTLQEGSALSPGVEADARCDRDDRKPMKLSVLGAAGATGMPLVEQALAGGH